MFNVLFITNIGSPQGDAASALFFIIYLALSLLVYIKREHNPDKFLPNQLKDHNYSTPTDNTFTLDQQYADDCSWCSTGSHVIDDIVSEIPPIPKERNLHINIFVILVIYSSTANAISLLRDSFLKHLVEYQIQIS